MKSNNTYTHILKSISRIFCFLNTIFHNILLFISEPHNNDDSMEIDDDEDFDLETPNRTQSLGNSGVTITPISHLNKSKRSPSMGEFVYI